MKGIKGSPQEYLRDLERRHNLSAEIRSVGGHAKLPDSHPLCCTDIGESKMGVGIGGRQGSLPASNESVSSRRGPRLPS